MKQLLSILLASILLFGCLSKESSGDCENGYGTYTSETGKILLFHYLKEIE